MPQVQKNVIWATVDGQKVALSQTYGPDGEPQLVSESTPMPVKGSVQLTGSNTPLETNSVPNKQGLAVKTTANILNIPTPDGTGQSVHPSVVYIAEGFGGYKYWMAHTPYAGGDFTKENPNIAASNDGITWVVPAGVTNPLFPYPGTSNYSDTHLLYDYYDKKLIIYWNHNGIASFRTTSTDGVTWTAKQEVFPKFAASPSVIKYNNSKFVAYVCSGGGEVYRMESTDGINFNKRTTVNFDIEGFVWHGCIELFEDGWHGVLTIAQKNRENSKGDLYYCHSVDGFNFKIYPVPLLNRTTADERLNSVYRSTLVKINDKVRVYYSQWGKNNVWKIGYFDTVPNIDADYRAYPEGRIVFPIFDGAEFRDTTAKLVSMMTDNRGISLWNRYKNKSIIFTNGHDQPLTLKLQTNFRGNDANNASDELLKYNGGTPQTYSLTIPVGNDYAPVLVTSEDFPLLKSLMPNEIWVQVKAATAPTAGKLSMRMALWN